MTLVTTSRDALAMALRTMLTDNALCIAADERGFVYDRANASDSDLATADRDFCEEVERITLDALLASGAVRDVSTLADDEALVERVRSKTALSPGAEFIVRWVLRALAAALEGGDPR